MRNLDDLHNTPMQPAGGHEHNTPKVSVEHKDLKKLERKILKWIVIGFIILSFFAMVAIRAKAPAEYAVMKKAINDATVRDELEGVTDKKEGTCKCSESLAYQPHFDLGRGNFDRGLSSNWGGG